MEDIYVAPPPKRFVERLQMYLCEVLGTFWLLTSIVFPGATGQPAVLVPWSVGFCITMVVFCLGKVSGAHINPAATLALWLRGKVGHLDAVVYILCQILGSILSCLACEGLCNKLNPLGGHMGGTRFAIGPQVGAELIFTFFLMFVIVQTATNDDTNANRLAAFPIGLVVSVSIICIGPISGCCLNPAVGLGVHLTRLMLGRTVRSQDMANHVLTPLAGALIAVLAYWASRANRLTAEDKATFPLNLCSKKKSVGPEMEDA
eukprot:Filipodium_phascolosomae@DN2087_c0_g1_i1.p1